MATSEDLTAFQALWMVHAEEAEHARDIVDSGDGKVIVSGRESDDIDPWIESDG